MPRVALAILLLLAGSLAAELPRRVNAGIIPFACDGTAVRYLLAFDPIAGRHGWGTFGGRPQGNETAPQTALREFVEETNCAFRADEVGALAGPSRAGGFHSYVARIPFRTPAQIAAPRTCADVERSDWIWVTQQALLAALDRPDDEPRLDALTPERPIHLWSKAARSLRQARRDRLLPPPGACRR